MKIKNSTGWYKTRNMKLTVFGQSKERNPDLNKTDHFLSQIWISGLIQAVLNAID